MATATTMSNSDAGYGYGRLKEVKQFDDSKVGVKGLVDLALTSIPKIFIHPKQTLSDFRSDKDLQNNSNNNFVPMTDLSGERSAVVEQVARACREEGFFQVVNHGIQQEWMDRTITGIKGFHEQAMEVKAQLYGRDKPVPFFCNFYLFRSKAASWRFNWKVLTEQILSKLPETCRKEMVEWSLHSTRVAELLMELMCKGLGLNPTKLKDATCLEGWISVGHFLQPWCTECWRILRWIQEFQLELSFSPGGRERRYGPFTELISTEKPDIYHDFLLTEYGKKLSTKESGEPITDCFMIRER